MGCGVSPGVMPCAIAVGSCSCVRVQQRWPQRPRPRKHALMGASNKESVHVADLKKEVMMLVSGTQRGKQAAPAQRVAINKAIAALEAANPTKQPVKSPQISGSWALVYQGPASIKEIEQKPSVDATLEGPFLARLQPLSRGLVRTRANVQVIDLAGGVVENLATFTVLGTWEGSINIKGTVAPAAPPEEDVKVDVVFKEFELKLGALSTTISLAAVKPKGWVLTTYLDEDTRVGRGDKGSVFLTRRMSSQAP